MGSREAKAPHDHSCCLHYGFATHSGRWEKTGIRGQWRDLLKELISSFPWTLAPVE